ncbi:hypothetical protein EMCRGX_G010646 [Ephydatia muelleri]
MQRELQSEGDLYSVLPEVPASNWLFVPQDHQHGMLYIGMHKTSRYTDTPEHVAKLEEIVKQAITNKEHTTLANKYEALRRNYEIRIHHNIACTEHKNIPTRIKNEACIPAPVEDSHQQLLQTFHVELLSCYGAMLKAKHNGLVLARYLELELVPAGMSSKQRPQVPDPPQWFTRDREAIKKKAAINKMPLLIKLCKEAKEELLNELVKEEEAMSPSKEALEAKQKKATQAFLRKLDNLSRSGRAAMVPKPEPSTDTRKVKERTTQSESRTDELLHTQYELQLREAREKFEFNLQLLTISTNTYQEIVFAKEIENNNATTQHFAEELAWRRKKKNMKTNSTATPHQPRPKPQLNLPTNKRD